MNQSLQRIYGPFFQSYILEKHPNGLLVGWQNDRGLL